MRVLDVGCGWGIVRRPRGDAPRRARHRHHAVRAAGGEGARARAREAGVGRQGRHPRAGLPRAGRRAVRPRSPRSAWSSTSARSTSTPTLRQHGRRAASPAGCCSTTASRGCATATPEAGAVLRALRVPRRRAAAPVARSQLGDRERAGLEIRPRRRASGSTTRRRCATGRAGSTTGSTRRRALAGEERVRVWRLYLRAARRGFSTGFTSVYQVRARGLPDRGGDAAGARLAEQDRVVVGVGDELVLEAADALLAVQPAGVSSSMPRGAHSNVSGHVDARRSRCARPRRRRQLAAVGLRTASLRQTERISGSLADEVVLHVGVDLVGPDARGTTGAAARTRGRRRGPRTSCPAAPSPGRATAASASSGSAPGGICERRAAVDEHERARLLRVAHARAPPRRSRPSSGRRPRACSAPRWSSTAAMSSACWAMPYGAGSRCCARGRAGRARRACTSPPSASRDDAPRAVVGGDAVGGEHDRPLAGPAVGGELPPATGTSRRSGASGMARTVPGQARRATGRSQRSWLPAAGSRCWPPPRRSRWPLPAAATALSAGSRPARRSARPSPRRAPRSSPKCPPRRRSAGRASCPSRSSTGHMRRDAALTELVERRRRRGAQRRPAARARSPGALRTRAARPPHRPRRSTTACAPSTPPHAPHCAAWRARRAPSWPRSSRNVERARARPPADRRALRSPSSSCCGATASSGRAAPIRPPPAPASSFGRDPAVFQYYPGQGMQLQQLASWGRRERRARRLPAQAAPRSPVPARALRRELDPHGRARRAARPLPGVGVLLLLRRRHPAVDQRHDAGHRRAGAGARGRVLNARPLPAHRRARARRVPAPAAGRRRRRRRPAAGTTSCTRSTRACGSSTATCRRSPACATSPTLGRSRAARGALRPRRARGPPRRRPLRHRRLVAVLRGRPRSRRSATTSSSASSSATSAAAPRWHVYCGARTPLRAATSASRRASAWPACQRPARQPRDQRALRAVEDLHRRRCASPAAAASR